MKPPRFLFRSPLHVGGAIPAEHKAANAVRLCPIVGRIEDEAVERTPAWAKRFPKADDGREES